MVDKRLKKKGVVGPNEEPMPGREIPDYIFKINDVTLEIPPTQISVHKEDMFWQWKTLRTKVSTKVPSGRGVCHVQLSIVFTPDLLLHLHRLIVQFQHSPFCWIENQYLRESIVPQWPIWQLMAFTMVSFNVSSMKGNPGSFIVELDLRWFNYFPYTPNFWMRDEWKTWPIIPKNHSSDLDDPEDTDNDTDKMCRQLTIPTYSTYSEEYNDLMRQNPSLPNSGLSSSQLEVKDYSLIAQKKNIEGVYSVKDLINTHAGTSFDLQPLPARMQPADPVLDPSLSRIYVRYINYLQQKALFENFNIDVARLIIDSEGIPELNLNGDKLWSCFTYGREGGAGIVHGLHSTMLPSSTRDILTGGMLASAERIYLYYDQYKALQYEPKLYEKVRKQRRAWLAGAAALKRKSPKTAIDRAKLIEARRGYDKDKTRMFRTYLAAPGVETPHRMTKPYVVGVRDGWTDTTLECKADNDEAVDITQKLIDDNPSTLGNMNIVPGWHLVEAKEGEGSLEWFKKKGAKIETVKALIEQGVAIDSRCAENLEAMTPSGVWEEEVSSNDQMFHLKWYPPVWDGWVSRTHNADVAMNLRDKEGELIITDPGTPDDWTDDSYTSSSISNQHKGIDIKMAPPGDEDANPHEGMPVFATEQGILSWAQVGNSPLSGYEGKIKH